ncbi:unnamed protein product [Rotaria sp. Silwood1]|nr:unnamed protein product [Rotaria sp. Silwood1]CAF3573733.1 unnamed protein product [Rotaria sp. Silwood1]CAF4793401.1 unnamed protein product [Rotaria sp. Silwood1]
MSSTHKDELINNFIDIAQCSREIAAQYLEAAEWNEQAALDFFLDSGDTQRRDSFPSTEFTSSIPKTNQNIPDKTVSSGTDDNDLDDDLLQSALEDSLRIKPPEKSPVIVPKRINSHKSIISSNINTFNNDDNFSDDEGQAFYAGGSEHSGQQIIGPPKSKDNNKKVTNVFEAARKQGATEVHDDDYTSSSHKKTEKPFAGVGYSLGDDHTPSRTQEQSSSAATSNQVEDMPIRFYSNGFTVGDGELRKIEDNQEFMDYIKRGEVPPELRNLNKGGRQVQVRLKDHRDEEYKHVAPKFKPFGGSGNTVGISNAEQTPFKSSMVSSGNTTLDSSDEKSLEILAEKRLKSSSSSTTIRLRLPDMSKPICIKIDLNRTLDDIRKFLTENVQSLRSNAFEFMEPPSTKIKREDEKRKISDTKLSNSALVVRRIT